MFFYKSCTNELMKFVPRSLSIMLGGPNLVIMSSIRNLAVDLANLSCTALQVTYLVSRSMHTIIYLLSSFVVGNGLAKCIEIKECGWSGTAMLCIKP